MNSSALIYWTFLFRLAIFGCRFLKAGGDSCINGNLQYVIGTVDFISYCGNGFFRSTCIGDKSPATSAKEVLKHAALPCQKFVPQPLKRKSRPKYLAHRFIPSCSLTLIILCCRTIRFLATLSFIDWSAAASRAISKYFCHFPISLDSS